MRLLHIPYISFFKCLLFRRYFTSAIIFEDNFMLQANQELAGSEWV